MSIPTILFGVLLSTLYGSAFHFLRGGSGRRFLVDLAVAWAGFWAGDSLGYTMGWPFWSVGVLNAGRGTVVSLALLLVGDLLTHIRLPAGDEDLRQKKIPPPRRGDFVFRKFTSPPL